MKATWLIWGALAAGCVMVNAAGPQLSAPIVPADPDAAGRELAAKLRTLCPAESLTNSATLRTYAGRKLQRELPLHISVQVGETNWTTTYLTNPQDNTNQTRLSIVRNADGSAEYQWHSDLGSPRMSSTPSGSELMTPFAQSEFWLADLGMDFLHWPTQRLLKKEICRGQSCDKLESRVPLERDYGYVRVVSWFDIDTGGPVLVEAYDAAGRMVKEFKPNDFKKVNGQWQVEEVEILNPRTDSRSTIRFDFGKPKD